MLRPGDSPAVDLRHSAHVLRSQNVRIRRRDAEFLVANDRDTWRRIRCLQVLGQLRDIHRRRSKHKTTLAGSQELLSLLPTIEAHLDLYRALGLPVERARLRGDGELRESAAAATTQLRERRRTNRSQARSQVTGRRLRQIKRQLPSRRAIDHQERAAFAHYRAVLDRVIRNSEKVLGKVRQRSEDDAVVRSFTALRETVVALRSLLPVSAKRRD